MMLLVMSFFLCGNGEHKMDFGTPEEIFQCLALGKTETIQNTYCINSLCAKSHRICVQGIAKVLSIKKESYNSSKRIENLSGNICLYETTV